MPGIILLILSVIGRILLVILLLILILLLIILLVPLWYRIDAGKDTGIRVEARAGWLLKLVQARLSLDTEKSTDKLLVLVRAAWLTLYDSRGKEGRAQEGHPDKSSDGPYPKAPDQAQTEAEQGEKTGQTEQAVLPGQTDPADPYQEVMTVSAHETGLQELPADDSIEEDRPVSLPTETVKDPEPRQTEDAPAGGAEPQGRTDRLQGVIGKLLERLRHLLEFAIELPGTIPGLADDAEDRFDGVQGRIRSLAEKKDALVRFCEEEGYGPYFCRCLEQLKKLLVYLLPGIRLIRLHYGFADPSLTGKVLGGLSLLYPLCGDRMELQPEFEDKLLEGRIILDGRIRLGRILWILFPVIVNRRFFRLLKRLKNL